MKSEVPTRPVPTVREAARVLLLDEQGRLLLWRVEDPNIDIASLWITVGGGLEPGESFEEAALRELAEETGLDLVEVTPRVIGVYEGGGRDPRDTAEEWSRSHAFVVELSPHLAAQTLLAGDDTSEARWHEVAALPPLAFDHAQIISDAMFSVVGSKDALSR